MENMHKVRAGIMRVLGIVITLPVCPDDCYRHVSDCDKILL